jgi:hypothetical protein
MTPTARGGLVLCLALAFAGGCAHHGGSSAGDQARTPAAGVHEVRVDRWVWNTVGESPDLPPRACGAAGARLIEHTHDSRDVLAGVLTLGVYTPMHVRVTCRTNHTASR